MASPLLIHVGYHKTATTWMQRSLFMPSHGFRQIAAHAEAWDHVVSPHGLRFDPAVMQAVLAAGMKQLAPGEVPVLSSEILSGHPFDGGRESDVYAERLARIAPDARIVISIRSQLRILPSVYMQYVRRGGTLPFDRFFAGNPGLGYFGFSPDHFAYDRLVARYQALFGADAVHVITQESLQADIAAACARLAAFAGATRFDGMVAGADRASGVSDPEYAVPVLRRVNHVLQGPVHPWPALGLGNASGRLFRGVGWLLRRQPVSAWLGGHRPVTRYVAQHFKGYFDASNQQLATVLGTKVDLSAYPGIRSD